MSADNKTLNVKTSWDYALENESWITPMVDIYEENDSFVLLASMPGVDKKNIKVKLEGESLVIMGRIDVDELDSKEYLLKETEVGNYYRRFKISETVDEDNLDANFENGQLKIKLPKQLKSGTQVIEIK